jgi:peroxiredoxin
MTTATVEQAQPGQRHTARWVAVGVLVVAAGLIAVLATRPPATVDEVQNPVVGKLAPPISGETLAGTHYSLPRAPGEFVVVSFFASWCEQCQSEGPGLVAFQFQHRRSHDATVVSVMFSDSPADARASQAQLGVTWPTMADNGGGIALDYGVRQLPSTFVIAPDGRVVASIVSPVTPSQLDQVIAKARAEHA